MAFKVVRYMILRIPSTKFKEEMFTIGGNPYPTEEVLRKVLRQDKSVISFYKNG